MAVSLNKESCLFSSRISRNSLNKDSRISRVSLNTDSRISMVSLDNVCLVLESQGIQGTLVPESQEGRVGMQDKVLKSYPRNKVPFICFWEIAFQNGILSCLSLYWGQVRCIDKDLPA